MDWTIKDLGENEHFALTKHTRLEKSLMDFTTVIEKRVHSRPDIYLTNLAIDSHHIITFMVEEKLIGGPNGAIDKQALTRSVCEELDLTPNAWDSNNRIGAFTFATELDMDYFAGRLAELMDSTYYTKIYSF